MANNNQHQFTTPHAQDIISKQNVQRHKLEKYRELQRLRREEQALKARGGYNNMSREYFQSRQDALFKEINESIDIEAEIRAAEEFYADQEEYPFDQE